MREYTFYTNFGFATAKLKVIILYTNPILNFNIIFNLNINTIVNLNINLLI